MCLKLEAEIATGRLTGRKFIILDGIRYSPDAKIGDLIQCLDAIVKKGGERVFQQNIADLLQKLKPVSKSHLQELQYGIRLLQVNYDVYDKGGDVIFKGASRYMENFLAYSNLRDVPFRMERLAQTVDDWQDVLNEFRFDPDLFKKVTGVDYPEEIERGFGYSPDFALTDELVRDYVYRGLKENANIKIKMSGNYAEDFKRANAIANIPAVDIPKGADAPAGFVWHHFDHIEFDEDGTMTCIMQLIRKEVHDKVVQAPEHTGAINRGTEHAGACAIWKRYFDIVGYDY